MLTEITLQHSQSYCHTLCSSPCCLQKASIVIAIVVIVNWFMKMIHLRAKTMNISLEEIAKIYREDIWKLHGVPRKILSDRGPQFASKFIEEFTKALGTKRQLLITYYSQTDGQTKRINQQIGIFLWHYVNYQLDNWTDWLAAAEF